MKLLAQLDIFLVAFGLLALLPPSWNWFRRRRAVLRRAHWFGVQMAMMLAFFLGLGSLMAAGLDVGLTLWDQACRPVIDDHPGIGESMMAPDFSLPVLDEDRSIRLSAFRGHKPVVLIFGSFG